MNKTLALLLTSAFSLIAAPIVSSASTKTSAISPRKNASPEWVRIGLRLTTYERMGDSEAAETRIQRILQHTLRAKTLKSNHFYLERYHIHSEPTRWNRDTNRYQIRLTFFQRFGKNGDVEELLGNVELHGFLHGDQSPYILHGTASKTFKNKFGQEILAVSAGFHNQDEERISAALD